MTYKIVIYLLIMDHQNICTLGVENNDPLSTPVHFNEGYTSPGPGDLYYSASDHQNLSVMFTNTNLGYLSASYTTLSPGNFSTSYLFDDIVSERNLTTDYGDSNFYDGSANPDKKVASHMSPKSENLREESITSKAVNPIVSTSDFDELRERSKFRDAVYFKYKIFKHHDRRYVFVEPVNCREFDGQDIHAEPGYSNEYNVTSDSDHKSDTIRRDNSSTDAEHKIRELGFLEVELFSLYNKAVRTSKQFSCQLKLDVGRRALDLSRKYVDKRRNFLNKASELTELIKKENKTKIDEFVQVEFIERKLYEKNLNFAKNMTRMLEDLCSLIEKDHEISEMSKVVNKHVEEYKRFSDITVIGDLVAELGKLMELHRVFLLGAEKVIEKTGKYRNLNHIFETPTTSKLMDLESRKATLKNITVETEIYMYRLEEQKSNAGMYESAEIITLGIIFVIGIIGNGLLLLIFIRHKELRASPNLILLNLTIVDIFSLIVNIPVFYSTGGYHGDAVCKAYQFIRTLCVGVGVYSLVVMCFQRFATLLLTKNRCQFFIGGGLNSVLVVGSVWILGSIMATPHAIISGVKGDGFCYTTKSSEPIFQHSIALFDLVMLCVIPVFLITVFTGFTVEGSRTNVWPLTGEVVIKKQSKGGNILSSNIIGALILVFTLTYVSFYLFRFVFVWSGMKTDTFPYVFLFFGVYALISINSCLNPIILFIVSRKLRSYLINTFRCNRGNAEETENQTSVGASTATIESTL